MDYTTYLHCDNEATFPPFPHPALSYWTLVQSYNVISGKGGPAWTIRFNVTATDIDRAVDVSLQVGRRLGNDYRTFPPQSTSIGPLF